MTINSRGNARWARCWGTRVHRKLTPCKAQRPLNVNVSKRAFGKIKLSFCQDHQSRAETEDWKTANDWSWLCADWRECNACHQYFIPTKCSCEGKTRQSKKRKLCRALDFWNVRKIHIAFCTHDFIFRNLQSGPKCFLSFLVLKKNLLTVRPFSFLFWKWLSRFSLCVHMFERFASVGNFSPNVFVANLIVFVTKLSLWNRSTASHFRKKDCSKWLKAWAN